MTNELIFINQFYYLFPKWNDVLHAKLVLKGTFQGEEEHNVERFKTWTARRNALSVRDLKSSTLHRMLSQTRVCQLFQQLKSISVVVFLLVIYCSAVILWDMQPKISVRNCSTLLYLKLIAVSGHCTHLQIFQKSKLADFVMWWKRHFMKKPKTYLNIKHTINVGLKFRS